MALRNQYTWSVPKHYWEKLEHLSEWLGDPKSKVVDLCFRQGMQTLLRLMTSGHTRLHGAVVAKLHEIEKPDEKGKEDEG